ncbi:MAG: hypothetical protein ACXWUG_23510 [Polyangiales bacterium]
MRILPFLLIVGCSGNGETAAPAAVDASGDASKADAAFVLDEGMETTSTCPEAQPAEGDSCIGVGSVACAYPTCGGMLTMTCRDKDSTWTLLAKPACESIHCQATKPAEGSSCSDFPDGRVCNYWPVSESACVACTCGSGVWTCKDGCDQPLSSCKPGTACSPNTGCGAGKCNNFCSCATDATLHCSANPC